MPELTEQHGQRDRQVLDRRTALRLLGIAGFGAVVVACGGGTSSNSSGSSAKRTSTTVGNNSTDAASCVLSPEMTEGPFYLDLDNVRSDITEGKPGAALALALTVVDVATCKPISDAAVDIWHTDASGAYSGVQGVSGTFLRGTQLTGTDGVARFATIFPGWYQGRTVHIHVKVHVGSNEVHTGQLFFPDAFTASVYERAPYASRGQSSLKNGGDNIYSNGGAQSLLSPTVSGDGYAAGIVLGVKRF